jgi:signal transduction histidine kinase
MHCSRRASADPAGVVSGSGLVPAQQHTPGWAAWATASLRRLADVVLRGTIAMLLVLTAVSATAVIWAAQSLVSVNETGVPLQMANKQVLQDVTDIEAAIRGYSLSGGEETGALRPYYITRSYLQQDVLKLRELATVDRNLKVSVAQQELAMDRWLTEYVDPQLATADPRETSQLYATGKRFFDDVRSANADVDQAIEQATVDISDRARSVLFWTFVAVVLLPLLVIGVASAAARRLRHTALQPLEEVSGVLDRLREGDLTARADEHGPAEIREIAAALNLLAEESLRSRDIEDTVVSQIGAIDRVRTELVSTVSHELRTPLTSIQGYLELLDDQIGGQLDDTQAAMMAAVRRNLSRLQELTTNLLTLSRVEEAGLKVESLDLRAVAGEVVGDLRLTAAARTVTLRTIRSAAPVTVVGDRTQLFRAVLNLVSNAIKFSEPGDVVEVRVAPIGGEAVVEVVDEGIGIPAADLDGLGRRFFRASNATRSEIAGTGLGLRIVQTILDRHKGTLAIDSLEDAGTTVTLRLPLAHGLATGVGDGLGAGVAGGLAGGLAVAGSGNGD